MADIMMNIDKEVKDVSKGELIRDKNIEKAEIGHTNKGDCRLFLVVSEFFGNNSDKFGISLSKEALSKAINEINNMENKK